MDSKTIEETYAMNFTFFMTFVPQLNSEVPIVMGYEKCTPKNVELIKAYKGLQFIHSGNWWNLDPAKRTVETVLANQEKFYTAGKTMGFMSLNTPASLTNYEYWNIPETERRKAIQQCLENANWAREHKTAKAPIYCSLEVSTIEESKFWFRKALDEGHECFCRGVAEFLGNPKLRKKGIQTIFALTIGARQVLEDFPLHLSGLSSLYLLPIIAYLGATSVDGSTPVTSALGRGTVYTPDGRGWKCGTLQKWDCVCDFCKDFEGDLVQEFNSNRMARVQHNVAIWQEKVKEINRCKDKRELKEYIENELAKKASRYFQKLWDQVLKIEEDLQR